MTGLTRYSVNGQLEKYPCSNGEFYLAADVEGVLKDVKKTLELLRDYTLLDADPPELRAQNQRCQLEATRLLARLEGDVDDTA